LDLNINRLPCFKSEARNSLSYFNIFVKELKWIHILVLVLAAISAFLSWQEIHQYAENLNRTKKNFKEHEVR